MLGIHEFVYAIIASIKIPSLAFPLIKTVRTTSSVYVETNIGNNIFTTTTGYPRTDKFFSKTNPFGWMSTSAVASTEVRLLSTNTFIPDVLDISEVFGNKR